MERSPGPAATLAQFCQGENPGTGLSSLVLLGLFTSEGIATAQVGDAIAHWRFDERSGTTALDSSTNNHVGTIVPPIPPVWSAPVSLVSAYGRIALGNRVHVVGHSGGNLVHRSSQDNGATWSALAIVASASSNYPMQ